MYIMKSERISKKNLSDRSKSLEMGVKLLISDYFLVQPLNAERRLS